MATGPTRKDIISALKDSGYLTEQEVATQLEALGYQVSTNKAFEDKDEGKSREIDVQAIRRVAYNEKNKLAAYIEIFAECKNTSNPFVFIGRPKNASDNQKPPFEFTFPIRQYEERRSLGPNRSQAREKAGFFQLGFDKVHFDFKTETKAVQFCRIDRKGNTWHANHGGLYDAIFYPMAKAIVARKADIPQNLRDDEWKYFWFLVPLVVVTGEIFYVDSTKTDPAPEERDYVTFKRELQSQNLKGTFSISFVRQKRLEAFVSDCLGPLIERAVDLTTNHAHFVLRREIAWEE